MPRWNDAQQLYQRQVPGDDGDEIGDRAGERAKFSKRIRARMERAPRNKVRDLLRIAQGPDLGAGRQPLSIAPRFS